MVHDKEDLMLARSLDVERSFIFDSRKEAGDVIVDVSNITRGLELHKTVSKF